MKSNKQFAAVVFLFCAAVFPAWTQEADAVAPPSWIEGTWTYTESYYGAEESEVEATIRFAADNIFFDRDYQNLAGLMAEGDVTAFTQNAADAFYEVFIRFADGYWFRETFEKPSGAAVMRSRYETSEGDSGEEIYTRGRL